MNDDFDDFFEADSEDEATETETETVAVEEEVEEITEEETEAEQSGEVSTEETPEAKPQSKVEASVEREDKGTMVPLAALIDEREKAKQRQSEIDRLNQRIAEAEAASRSSSIPDPYDDPTAYHEFLAREVDQRVQQQMQDYRIYESTERARKEHGDEAIAELEQWAAQAVAQDPSIGLRAMQAPDPVAFVMELKKRQEAYAALEQDEEAFILERAKALGLVPAAPAVGVTQPAPKRASAPKSLASASNRQITQTDNNGEDDFFDDIFK